MRNRSASSIWPMRSRRTLVSVTSTPHFSQTMPLILHALVFAAQAFVILDRTEDTRAEQAITLRLERPVVDGFRLLDLTEGPGANALRARRSRSGSDRTFGPTAVVKTSDSSFMSCSSLGVGFNFRVGGKGGMTAAPPCRQRRRLAISALNADRR